MTGKLLLHVRKLSQMLLCMIRKLLLHAWMLLQLPLGDVQEAVVACYRGCCSMQLLLRARKLKNQNQTVPDQNGDFSANLNIDL